MRLIRSILILLVIVAITIITSHNNLFGNSSEVGACGRCGDRACVRSCGETPQSCPVDCGGTCENGPGPGCES
jgi:hypothetical protein